jgi:hypothetical protein
LLFVMREPNRGVPVHVHSTPASRRSAPPLDDICANARLCGTLVFLQFDARHFRHADLAARYAMCLRTRVIISMPVSWHASSAELVLPAAD